MKNSFLPRLNVHHENSEATVSPRESSVNSQEDASPVEAIDEATTATTTSVRPEVAAQPAIEITPPSVVDPETTFKIPLRKVVLESGSSTTNEHSICLSLLSDKITDLPTPWLVLKGPELRELGVRGKIVKPWANELLNGPAIESSVDSPSLAALENESENPKAEVELRVEEVSYFSRVQKLAENLTGILEIKSSKYELVLPSLELKLAFPASEPGDGIAHLEMKLSAENGREIVLDKKLGSSKTRRSSVEPMRWKSLTICKTTPAELPITPPVATP